MLTGFKIVNIGVEGLSEKEKNIVQIINILSLITVSASSLYLLLYIFLGTWVPMLINSSAILLYSVTFLWTYKKKYQTAKIWIFIVYMIHLFFLSFIIFTKYSGYHFYFLIIPVLAFLVFEYNEMNIKIMFSIISAALFFTIEMIEVYDPYIHLSVEMNRVLYLTSILIAFCGGLVVVFIFTFNIHKYENEQYRLIKNLQQALSEVKVLRGFIPICSSCKKIRDDQGYWNQIESYIQERSEAEFSHGICPECTEKMYGGEDWYLDMIRGNKSKVKKDE